ncbi:MAG: hypothetical protein NTW87_16020 [Planctomycetota bacterium]|nr:hypothetical protein [Planctomycetota bacterium]
MLARTCASLWCLVALLWVTSGRASEQLVFEDFEKLDLKKLPAGWSITNAGDFSLVDDPTHGKVLRINHQGNGWPQLFVQLDPAKVRGHVVRIAASTRFPGGYVPIDKKPWARPKLSLLFKDKSGKDHYLDATPEPNKPDWQDIENKTSVDNEVESVSVFLRVDLVAAEIFFDDFSVEMDPDPNSAPRKSKPAQGAGTPAVVAQPTPSPLQPPPSQPAPTPPATGGDQTAPAAKAPKRALEDGGMLFGPEIAAALQKTVKAQTANTYALIGPGLPIKELETAKPPDKWTRVPNKDMLGPLASPRRLLPLLPDYIAKNKPEVVFLFGETTTSRKMTMLEALDWEDLARICLRMGVVPVLAVPPAAPVKEGPIGMQEDLRTSMVKAATDANCPAVDLKTPAQIPRLVTQMVHLLDRHVYCRVPLDAPATGTTKKPEDE